MAVELEEYKISEYVEKKLKELSGNKIAITGAEYHHNTKYQTAPLILKNGILSMTETNKLGITNYTEEQMSTFDDITSHVNGNDGISLAKMDLDDLYKDEEEYDARLPQSVDFRISDSVKAARSNTRYGNEFIAKLKIETDKLKAVDVRILKYIKQMNSGYKIDTIEDLVERYNSLIEIAKIIKELHLDIPLREMSNEQEISLDIDQLSEEETISIKH